jgi:hypothetical protein
MDEDYEPSNREKSKRTGSSTWFCFNCEGRLNKLGCGHCSKKAHATALKNNNKQKPKYNV